MRHGVEKTVLVNFFAPPGGYSSLPQATREIVRGWVVRIPLDRLPLFSPEADYVHPPGGHDRNLLDLGNLNSPFRDDTTRFPTKSPKISPIQETGTAHPTPIQPPGTFKGTSQARDRLIPSPDQPESPGNKPKTRPSGQEILQSACPLQDVETPFWKNPKHDPRELHVQVVNHSR